MAQTQLMPKWSKKSMNFTAMKEMKKNMESLSLNTVYNCTDCSNIGE